MLGLDLVKLPSYVGGDALTPPKVIALEIADALVHVFDLQILGGVDSDDGEEKCLISA